MSIDEERQQKREELLKRLNSYDADAVAHEFGIWVLASWMNGTGLTENNLPTIDEILNIEDWLIDNTRTLGKISLKGYEDSTNTETKNKEITIEANYVAYNKDRAGFYYSNFTLRNSKELGKEKIDNTINQWFNRETEKDGYWTVCEDSPLYKVGFRYYWRKSDEELFSKISQDSEWDEKNVIVELRLCYDFWTNDWDMKMWHTLPMMRADIPSDMIPKRE